jgi:hypothetical protein
MGQSKLFVPALDEDTPRRRYKDEVPVTAFEVNIDSLSFIAR